MTPTPEVFSLLARSSRRALLQHDLRERERALCEWVITLSYDLGRVAAYIPSQSLFCLLTSMTKGNVSTAISSLERGRVLRVQAAAGLYTLQPDPERWRVLSRFRSEAARAAAERTERWLHTAAACTAEQLDLLPPLPDLDALLLEEDRAAVLGRAMGTPDPHSRHAPPIAGGAPSRHPPDDSHRIPALHGGGDTSAGAAAPEPRELSRRIAESMGQYPALGENFPTSGPLDQVPESGTTHIKTLKCDPKGSHLSVTSKCAVPDSGTSVPLDRPLKPSAERERALLDELAAVCGADAMAQHGGGWRLRIRADAPAVREALGELKLRTLNHRLRPVRNPGAWLRQRYEAIRAEGQSNKPKNP